MSMDFVCPVCSMKLPRDAKVDISHTEVHIVDEIKKTHPNWTEKNGICKKCYQYYKSQLKA